MCLMSVYKWLHCFIAPSNLTAGDSYSMWECKAINISVWCVLHKPRIPALQRTKKGGYGNNVINSPFRNSARLTHLTFKLQSLLGCHVSPGESSGVIGWRQDGCVHSTESFTKGRYSLMCFILRVFFRLNGQWGRKDKAKSSFKSIHASISWCLHIGHWQTKWGLGGVLLPIHHLYIHW